MNVMLAILLVWFERGSTVQRLRMEETVIVSLAARMAWVLGAMTMMHDLTIFETYPGGYLDKCYYHLLSVAISRLASVVVLWL